jgi:hypothetical protein
MSSDVYGDDHSPRIDVGGRARHRRSPDGQTRDRRVRRQPTTPRLVGCTATVDSRYVRSRDRVKARAVVWTHVRRLVVPRGVAVPGGSVRRERRTACRCGDLRRDCPVHDRRIPASANHLGDHRKRVLALPPRPRPPHHEAGLDTSGRPRPDPTSSPQHDQRKPDPRAGACLGRGRPGSRTGHGRR